MLNLNNKYIGAFIVVAVALLMTLLNNDEQPNDYKQPQIIEAIDSEIPEVEISEPEISEPEITETTIQLDNNHKVVTVNEPQPQQQANQSTNENQCIPLEKFNQDPRHQIIANYIKNDYLAGEIDYINYLNNDELEELARNNNVKAMYILGVNHQWNALYEGDRAERFRPQEIEKQPIIVRKAFNLESWQQAQRWLERAATHGQISALIDISVGYQQQAYMLEEQGQYSEKVIQKIKQNAIAYMQLHQQLAPEISTRSELNTLIEELGEPDPALLNLLQRRWKKEREDLGFSEQVELNLPPEIAEINQLRENLCP